MYKVTSAKVLDGYRLWLQFSDGVRGEVDLSHLVGKGVFSAWRDRGAFEKVQVGSRGEVQWGNEIDLCPDALYLEVTGKSPVSDLAGKLPPRAASRNC